MQGKYLALTIFTTIFLFFSFAFYLQNLKKGSFYGDETIFVEMSWFRNRNVAQIFKDAASRSQPPLEFIIREKLFTPLGSKLGLVGRFPEMYQRSLSLLWWLIPISYFTFFLKDYSTKNRLILIVTFALLGASDFLGFYLTEAKHYSAIAAIFFSMVLIMLSDKINIRRWAIRFLIVSSILPLLHTISFPYYFLLVGLFLLYYYKSFKNKEKFLRILLLLFIYFMLITAMYIPIQKASLAYQHPGLANLTQIEYFDSHLKWTMDWIFFGTPLYIIFKAVPTFVTNNLFPIFIISGIPIAIFTARRIKMSLSAKLPTLDVTAVFPLIITFLWPLTVAAVFYQSALFGGERYSIVIMVATMFYVSALIVNAVQKVVSGKKLQIFIVISLCFLTAVYGLARNLKYFRPKVATAEAIFVRDNAGIINNADNYIIADLGAYTPSVEILSELTGAVIGAKYLHCPTGLFQKDNKSILNEWIAGRKSANVYLLTSGQPINPPNKIIWQYQYLTLYKVSQIDASLVCDDQNRLGNCYQRCTKGADLSNDRLRFPHTTPFLDNKNLQSVL